MNKSYLYIVLFLFLWKSNAQNFNVHSNDYAIINSYSGLIKPKAYWVQLDGTGTLNLPTWRLSVRVTQPITNGSQIFPANKISLLPTITYGNFNQGGTVPSIPQIGMPLQTFLQEAQEVFLVPQSQAELYETAPNNQYYNFWIDFDLNVEGGAYLSEFTTYSEFQVPLEFRFYDNNNTIIGVVQKNYTLQMAQLSGTPPDPTPQFSITIGGNAVNGLLELKTKSDYIEGTSVVYQNGLTVNANTAYQIKAKSLQGSFTSNTGNTLPLNTIQLALIPSSGNSGAVFPIWLSSSSQAIASGSSTQGTPVHYDIKYSSKPNDVNLVTAKMEQYTTMLQYEIIPQ